MEGVEDEFAAMLDDQPPKGAEGIPGAQTRPSAPIGGRRKAMPPPPGSMGALALPGAGARTGIGKGAAAGGGVGGSPGKPGKNFGSMGTEGDESDEDEAEIAREMLEMKRQRKEVLSL